MSESSQEQEGSIPSEEVTNQTAPPDKLEPTAEERGPVEPPSEAPGEIREPIPCDPTGIEAEGVSSEDTPWEVVEAEESLPEGVTATAYFYLNGCVVLVCNGGFYSKHEGNFQALPVKVLIDKT